MKGEGANILKVFLWGTGDIADKILNRYDVFAQYNIMGFIDNDPHKHNGEMFGKHIYAPEILLTVRADKIIILASQYEEIYKQITQELKLTKVLIEDHQFFQKQLEIKPGILKRYKDTTDLEIKTVLEWLNKNELNAFNYPFSVKYNFLNISVLYDEDCGMFYVIHQGKKMYFAKSLDTENAVASYYKSILLEQDEESPHRYLDEQFTVCYGDIVVDAGVAEGNFALQIIDKVSRLYLIEADSGWVEALKETFKDYQDKVIIIPKFLTSTNDGEYATLDSLIDEQVDFIKMDIEGNEWDALLGAARLIRQSKKIKCAICAYHAEYDEILIRSVLTEYGMRCTTTRGYMYIPSWGRNGNVTTRLCRGIVRGVRN